MVRLSTHRAVTKTVLLTAVMALGLAGFTVSGQIRGFNGSWKLNPEKTRGPHAKREILTFRVTRDEEHYTVDEVEQDGSLFKTEYTAKFDGKDYPNHNLVTGATTYVRLKKIDDTTEELENRDATGGPVTSKYQRVLSGDGKTITSSIIGANGAIFSVRVFERQ